MAALWALPTALLTQLCLPLAAVAACAGVLLHVGAFGRRFGRACHPAALCALPALLAALPAVATGHRAVTAGADAWPSGPVHVRGTVRDTVHAPLLARTYVWLDGDVRLVVPGELDAVAGDHLDVLARAAAPVVPDERPHLAAIAATVNVTPGAWSWRRATALLRHRLERELLRLVPGEPGAMLATLVLGRATRPSFEIAEAHRATGLSHLLAVSGAHAAMLALLLGLSGRARHLGASRARTTFVLVVLLVYGSLAGAEPPVLRAVVAFVLAAVAARTGRPFGIASALLAPALVTCLVAPTALLGPSFLLSYAAVLGLGIALRGRRPPQGAREWLADALRTSFWATLLTAPLTLWFFAQLAPWTILLTPLLAPMVALMLLLGLVAGALSCLAPAVAEPFGVVLRALAESYAWLVESADLLPGTPVPARQAPPPWPLLLVAAALGAAFVARRPTRGRLAAALTLVVLMWFVPPLSREREQLSLFAVGHGQAALLRCRGAQVLVDCGSLSGGWRAANAVHRSIVDRHVDLLVVTHADLDHHNGVPQLLGRVTFGAAALPMHLRDGDLHRRLAAAGVPLTWVPRAARVRPLDGVPFQVFAPDLPPRASQNDRSLWVRATIDGLDVLLCADAQETGTAAALASGFATRCDALVLPHHGRRNANAPALLQRTAPGLALASAATADGDTALGALARRLGARLYVTGRCGTVHLSGTNVTCEHAPGPRQPLSNDARAPPRRPWPR